MSFNHWKPHYGAFIIQIAMRLRFCRLQIWVMMPIQLLLFAVKLLVLIMGSLGFQNTGENV